MGTRLLSEKCIKDRFPHLSYVRIHTHEKNTATIYAWNGELELSDHDQSSLQQFATEYLHPYVCFKVKAYNRVQKDNVPQVKDVPEAIKKAAMSRNLNQNRIIEVMNRLFSCGQFTFNRYDSSTGTIHFDFQSSASIDHKDKGLIGDCLYEMIPLGSKCEVTFY